jgi:hypothetical protein
MHDDTDYVGWQVVRKNLEQARLRAGRWMQESYMQCVGQNGGYALHDFAKIAQREA